MGAHDIHSCLLRKRGELAGSYRGSIDLSWRALHDLSAGFSRCDQWNMSDPHVTDFYCEQDGYTTGAQPC